MNALLVGLIWVVIGLAILGVVYWALDKLAAALGAPHVVTVAIQVVCVLLGILILVNWAAGVIPSGPGWLRPQH